MEQRRTIVCAGPTFRPYARSAPPSSLPRRRGRRLPASEWRPNGRRGTDPLRFWLAAPVSRTKARQRRANIPPVGLHGQGRVGAPSANLHDWDRVRHARKTKTQGATVVVVAGRRRSAASTAKIAAAATEYGDPNRRPYISQRRLALGPDGPHA
jgi:hypothetical protein